MVALRREVVADVRRRLADAGEQVAGEVGAARGSPARGRTRPTRRPSSAPGGRRRRRVLEPRRHLAQEEARAAATPEIGGVAGLGVGVREVEAEVELPPLDPPLAVGRQPAPTQSGSARGRPSARAREPPAARVVGDPAVAVGWPTTQKTGRGASPCSSATAGGATVTRSPRGTASAACRRGARRRARARPSRAPARRSASRARGPRAGARRRRRRRSVVGPDEQAVLPVADDLGDARDRRRHDRGARGHRLGEDVRDAVAVVRCRGSGTAGRRRTRGGTPRTAAPGSSGPRAGCARPGRLGDPGAQPGAGVVVGADDHGLERDPAAVELSAGVDDDVEALLRHEAPDPEQPELPVGAGRHRGSLLSSSREKSAFRPW